MKVGIEDEPAGDAAGRRGQGHRIVRPEPGLPAALERGVDRGRQARGLDRRSRDQGGLPARGRRGGLREGATDSPRWAKARRDRGHRGRSNSLLSRRRSSRSRRRSREWPDKPPCLATCALLALRLLALAACNKPAAEAPKAIRPVLSMVVAQSSASGLALAGTVQPRVQTAFAFRVLGRMIARPVNAGDLVDKDQVLAAIDATALKLAAQAAAAELASSEAPLANATGVAERQSALLKSSATTQAQLERASSRAPPRKAASTRAQAAFAKAQRATRLRGAQFGFRRHCHLRRRRGRPDRFAGPGGRRPSPSPARATR